MWELPTASIHNSSISKLRKWMLAFEPCRDDCLKYRVPNSSSHQCCCNCRTFALMVADHGKREESSSLSLKEASKFHGDR